MPSGAPFRFVRDAAITNYQGTIFRFVRDVALTARSGAPFRFLRGLPFPTNHHGGVSGGTIASLEPLQVYGGVSGGTLGTLEPLQVYGGITVAVANLSPPFGFGAISGGEVAFAGLPPAIGLVAIAVASGKIALTWVDVSGKENGYRIERSLNGQNDWSVIGSVGESVIVFVDLNATPLIVFDYRVIAFNATEVADPSNVASAFSPAPGQPVPPPSTDPLKQRLLEFLSPGVYGLERDPEGNVGGNKF